MSLLFRRLAGLATLLATAVGAAYEEPKYTVLEKDGAYELRQYPARIAAETVAPGDGERAGNTAFMRLFGYISGKNQSEAKVAMTIPVTMKPDAATSSSKAGKSKGESIAMTIPVNTAPEGAGYRMAFFLPSQYTMETAPKPTDPSVKLREIPPTCMAVLRYSGSPSESLHERKLAKLRTWMTGRGLKEIGPAEKAVYNGPFTLPFLRRNESMVPIECPKK